MWPGAIDNIFPLFQSQTQTAFFESSPTETKRWVMAKKSEGKGNKKENKYKLNQIINGKQILLMAITNIKTYTHIL